MAYTRQRRAAHRTADEHDIPAQQPDALDSLQTNKERHTSVWGAWETPAVTEQPLAKMDIPAEPEWTYPPEQEDIPAMEDEAFLPDEDELGEDVAWLYENPPDYADPLDEEDLADLEDDLLTEEEQAELRRSNWALLSGLADFAGAILGAGAILVLVMLLVSLINWLMSDISQTFTLLQMRF